MNFGLIHLTDLHCTENSELSRKINSLCQEMKNELTTITKKYLVISGDIAKKGKKDEYNNAKDIIDEIVNELDISKVILVPGNHDCNFDYSNKIRENTAKNIDYNQLGKDGTVIENALQVQKDFWEFYKNYNEVPDNKMSYRIDDSLGSNTISFHCINTAWISKKDEEPGTLFFPVKLMDNVEKKDNENLNISVFHHPLNWFTPNTEPNNKNEFQEYINNLSNIKLIGHEHEQKSLKVTNLDKNVDSLEFSGKIFNKTNLDISGFQVINISLDNRKGYIKKYIWEEGLYIFDSKNTIDIQKYKNRKFNLQDKFLESIQDIKVPISFTNKEIDLSDIYVFPNIEESKLGYDKLEDYESSKNLLENEDMKKVVLEGESQIGKSSLLQILFLNYYKSGYYPILLKGEDINRPDINKIIKRKFNSIYDSSNNGFHNYKQTKKKYKILLIDDFHKKTISQEELENFINKVNDLYDNVILTIDASYSFSTELQTYFSNFKNYSIKSFGYKKTDELIEKYFSLKDDFYSLDEQEKLYKIRNTFDEVRNLLGDKILPSYPIFILTILKTLDKSAFSLKETSYGYCYETMLYLSLRSKAQLGENELTQYFSFIEQLAFRQFNRNESEFNEEYFKSFYDEYSEEHIIDNFSVLKNNLINSYILKKYNNTYRFGYKYIYYYLVGKHIAGLLNKDKGKEIVEDLFDKLHLEENANILVFVTHHTRNDEFIQDAVYHAMVPFEGIEPISLGKNCHYYDLLEDLGNEVTENIIETDIDPKKTREENLEKYDSERDSNGSNNEDISEINKPYVRAFKSIDIVAQIIKNRLGYLKKTEIIDYIEELYLNGFRTISSIGETFKEEEEELTRELIKLIIDEIHKRAEGIKEYRLNEPVTKEQIRNKVNNFFQITNLKVCLNIFSKLIDSVGIKDKKMKEIYNTIADRIDTPAARLVTFSIKSYYYGTSPREIKRLANEFENNPVALEILKSRTISYVYSNYVDRREKQKIASILNLEFKPSKKRIEN